MREGRTVVLLCLILLAIFLCYERVLDGPPIFDDGYVFDPSERAAEPNRRLTWLTFEMNFALFGEATVSFHLTNVLLHGLAVLACFGLLRELLLLAGRRRETALRIALLGAVLFGLSPVQTAAVSYIWQRAAVLAGLLSLTSLWLFAAGLRRRGGPAVWRIVLAAGLLPAAVLAKQNAVMVLPAMFGLVALFRPPGKRPVAAWIAALCILVASAIGVSLLWWGTPTPADAFARAYEHRAFSLGERLLTQPRVVCSLLTTVLLPLPSRLNLDPDVAVSTGPFTPWTTLPALFAVAALIVAGLLLVRRRPILSLGLLWFPLFLVPESTFAPLELSFDHRAYLPSVGICLLFALGLRALAVRYPRTGGALVAILLLSLAGLTTIRNEVWTSRVLMWEDAAGKSPEKARPRFNLALARRDTDDGERAVLEFRRALELAKDNVDYAAALNALVLERRDVAELLATAEFHCGHERYLAAEELIRAAIALRPSDPGLEVDLARVLFMSGSRDAALTTLRVAVFEGGFSDADRLRAEFGALARDPRFIDLLEAIE